MPRANDLLNAKSVVFVGTFTADGLDVAVEDGRLVIVTEGKARKFIAEVEQRTFSGAYALKRGQPVLYITERCVLRLTSRGMELVEVAPGIDIDRDILAHMEFAPIIEQPALMDAAIFAIEPMGLRQRMTSLPLSARFSYNAVFNMLFVNLEQLTIATETEIVAIRAEIGRQLGSLGSLGRRVFAIFDYTSCTIAPTVADRYAAMAEELARTFCMGVTHYGLKGALAERLGGGTADDSVVPLNQFRGERWARLAGDLKRA